MVNIHKWRQTGAILNLKARAKNKPSYYHNVAIRGPKGWNFEDFGNNKIRKILLLDNYGLQSVKGGVGGPRQILLEDQIWALGTTGAQII